ncbi:hypothetical protein Hanom_Chr03g00221871 [Helianthus anomalus]
MRYGSCSGGGVAAMDEVVRWWRELQRWSFPMWCNCGGGATMVVVLRCCGGGGGVAVLVRR